MQNRSKEEIDKDIEKIKIALEPLLEKIEWAVREDLSNSNGLAETILTGISMAIDSFSASKMLVEKWSPKK